MKKRGIFTILILIVIVGIIVLCTVNKESEPIEISYTEFLKNIQNDYFETIEMEKGYTRVKASHRDSNTQEEQYYVTEVPSIESFVDFVQLRIENGQNTPEITIIETSSHIGIGTIIDVVFFLYIAILIVMMVKSFKKMKNTSENTLSFMNVFNTDINYIEKMAKSNVKFSDVAGLEEEKAELVEIVDYIKNPERYNKLGAKIPKGILLSGEPGTGKTLLAKAVAGEAGVAYLAISGSEFVEKYVGVGASRIRGLFKEARKNTPCIIFIDEIDAVGAKREDGNNSEHNQTLEQLLTELDGFEDRRNIVVLAATNRASSLDPALTRPGRFDRKINVNLPDVKGREEILKLHARGKIIEEYVDFKSIAHNTAGYSGAELANLLNEAALIAARKQHEMILEGDIDEALKKITVGLEKAGRVVSQKERKLTAIHEAGHAIVAHQLESQSSIKEISIIPRGNAGGYTWQNRVEDKSYRNKTELKEKVIVLLAGRAAERIMLKDISTGASNDLEVANKLVREMIAIYGMDDEIGPVSLNGLNHSELGLFGEKLLSDIGMKTIELLKEAEKEAEKMIRANFSVLRTVSKELLDKETISGEEFDIIFRKFSSNE